MRWARPHMRFVPMKELEHQDIQSVYRARSLLVKQRKRLGPHRVLQQRLFTPRNVTTEDWGFS
jgi:hypothetical protein